MLLRVSISNTRKFFQKTLENFKSFFSNGYEKLPKSPNTSNSFTNLTFYDLHKSQKPNHPNADIITSSSSPLQQQFHPKSRNLLTTPKKDTTTLKPRRADEEGVSRREKPKVQVVHRRERMRFPVAEKLRELEMMMGMSNSEHVSDVQEFLHYYSRLHCPVYLDIVEQFFMDMYAEFLEPPLEPPRNAVSSRRMMMVGSYRGYKA